MTKYKYSFIAAFIYRYANIPASLLLLLYASTSLAALLNNWKYILPLLLNLILLYILNRFYFKSYKYFPFEISADNEKMICSNFYLSAKKIELKYSEITEIKGGLFSGNLSRPVYIYSGKNNITIGLHSHLTGFNKLLTTILSNINQPLYNKLLEEAKLLSPKEKNIRANKKARK